MERPEESDSKEAQARWQPEIAGLGQDLKTPNDPSVSEKPIGIKA